MSATTTSVAATSTSCGSTAQYELPVKDAACGVPNNDKYKGYLEKCAKPAGATAYDNDCALYSFAIGQSVKDLTDCLYDAGVDWKDVWCYGSTNATATETSYPTATSASKTSGKSDSSSTGTATGSSSTSTETSAGSAVYVSKTHVSVQSVLALSSLFVSAVLFGM